MPIPEPPESLPGESTSDAQLSDYEKLRAAKIEKHNALLRSLGLISAQEELESNALAWHKSLPTNAKRKRQEDATGNPQKSSKLAAKTALPPSRQSLRQRGKEPDGSEVPPSLKAESIQEMRQSRVLECRQVRLERARQYNDKVTNGTGKMNRADDPTGKLYDHTYYRIQSMTDKALEGRIKAIERAAGKQCIIKMAIFKSCLQDVGMWKLAELAGGALERLKESSEIEEEKTTKKKGKN
ncbi:unnamed protein product [Cylindrotheca closterium]|uniref:Uncharacterized protein n=1 Tax=Cylindrotheca closterium TaxID=2856 RepID=A0AAD2FRS6_9STRA|nr:unnamed protein product [Cylindrotheca closterium]